MYGSQPAASGGFQARFTAVGNLTGVGTADILAVDASNGNLYRYSGPHYNGAAKVRIGTGWGSMTSMTGVGDVTGDGVLDLLAPKPPPEISTATRGPPARAAPRASGSARAGDVPTRRTGPSSSHPSLPSQENFVRLRKAFAAAAAPLGGAVGSLTLAPAAQTDSVAGANAPPPTAVRRDPHPPAGVRLPGLLRDRRARWQPEHLRGRRLRQRRPGQGPAVRDDGPRSDGG
ncbi:VCBS repeat-containing protein [Streptomyces sp. RerS4]|uniref:FG-GAP repeat domain-containing protein n=1 Tax=Streptomyces sp. RerS4 TaxID=2942449 RepID=UPI0032E36116